MSRFFIPPSKMVCGWFYYEQVRISDRRLLLRSRGIQYLAALDIPTDGHTPFSLLTTPCLLRMLSRIGYADMPIWADLTRKYSSHGLTVGQTCCTWERFTFFGLWMSLRSRLRRLRRWSYWYKSGFPNGNCEIANVNSVECMMHYNTYNLCAFTPAHIGWLTDVPQYTVTTSPPGLLISVDGEQRVSPQIFRWGLGSQMEISVVTPQTLNGKNIIFSHGATAKPNHTPSLSRTFQWAISRTSHSRGMHLKPWQLYQKTNALPSPGVSCGDEWWPG